MTILSTLSRRAVVAGQTAMAALAALPGAAAASAKGAPESVAPAAPAVRPAPANWATATAENLEPLIGERFRVRSGEHGSFVLRLASVERSHGGPDRPAHLARKEGVIATFDGPDAPALTALGDQVLRVSHARLGVADLFMVPTPTRSGKPEMELILN